MKLITALQILVFSFPLFASDDCGSLEKLKLSLSVHASNILNSQTTRTLEGGAYKRKVVSSCDSRCKVIERKEVFLKYEPNHPDANKQGYVEYPSFKESTEILSFVSKMHKLEALSKYKKCGLSYQKLSRGFLVKYNGGPILQEEFILPDHNLISGWKRELRSGKEHLVSFLDSEDTSVKLPGEPPQ